MNRTIWLLAIALSLAAVVSSAQPSGDLRGAGATLPAPVYEKWFANYARRDGGAIIGYDAVGSEAGIRRLLAADVDFGASDDPEIVRELAPDRAADYLLFPTVAGAVVPIVNVPGVASAITFTPDALAAIYLGRATKWSDPVIAQANRGVHLPDLNIIVVHRSDGSGTTYALTAYLSKVSAEWQTRVGARVAPAWPTGRGAGGNEGVASMVRETPGAIGYVSFIFAVRAHVSYARVRNRHGEPVSATLESIAAATHAATGGRDLATSVIDAPEAGAYPITTFTWFVVPARIADEHKRTLLIGFLRWMLTGGQRQVAALGYCALPDELAAQAQAAVDRIR